MMLNRAQLAGLALLVGLALGIGGTLLAFERGALSDPLSAAVIRQLGQDEAACLLKEGDMAQSMCIDRIEAAVSSLKAAGNQLGVPSTFK